MITPEVILGDRYSGFGGDSAYGAWLKYGQHVHLPASPANFLFYNIQAGQNFALLDDKRGIDLFESSEGAASIQEVTQYTIYTSRSAFSSPIETATLYIGEDRILTGLTVNNNEITFAAFPNPSGFIAANVIQSLLVETISGNLPIFTGAAPGELVQFGTSRPSNLPRGYQFYNLDEGTLDFALGDGWLELGDTANSITPLVDLTLPDREIEVLKGLGCDRRLVEFVVQPHWYRANRDGAARIILSQPESEETWHTKQITNGSVYRTEFTDKILRNNQRLVLKVENAINLFALSYHLIFYKLI